MNDVSHVSEKAIPRPRAGEERSGGTTDANHGHPSKDEAVPGDSFQREMDRGKKAADPIETNMGHANAGVEVHNDSTNLGLMGLCVGLGGMLAGPVIPCQVLDPKTGGSLLGRLVGPTRLAKFEQRLEKVRDALRAQADGGEEDVSAA